MANMIDKELLKFTVLIKTILLKINPSLQIDILYFMDGVIIWIPFMRFQRLSWITCC